MRSGHKEAQTLFQQLGHRLGYRCRRTWNRQHPTDGVWLLSAPHAGHDELPVVALEVAVTEGGKSLRGSIATLESVSPALGILLIQEQEIRRGLIRDGHTSQEATAHINGLVRLAASELARSRQRTELWTFEQLERRARVAINPATPVTLKGIAS